MSIRCTAIRMSAGGTEHHHITDIRWIADGETVAKTSTRAEMVTFVEGGGKGYVRDARGDTAYLAVRTSSAGNKYVQTYADGIWKDNLLALPRF